MFGTVENSTLNNSANIVGWTDNEENSQAWILSVNEAGQFMLTNEYTGQFLAYKGAISVVTGTAL